MQFKEEKIEIKKLTEEFTECARILTAAKGQHLEVVISIYSDYINSDRQLLWRAWENLLHNAVEYTSVGGEISIVVKEEKDKLFFQIEDSGPGFSEEDLRHGTEQFYQDDKSRNSKDHYGMGLFIVQSFMKQQGGSLRLSNSDVTREAVSVWKWTLIRN